MSCQTFLPAVPHRQSSTIISVNSTDVSNYLFDKGVKQMPIEPYCRETPLNAGAEFRNVGARFCRSGACTKIKGKFEGQLFLDVSFLALKI